MPGSYLTMVEKAYVLCVYSCLHVYIFIGINVYGSGAWDHEMLWQINVARLYDADNHEEED